MCFGGQPKAPINKPAYAPEDANKHFDVTEQEDGGTKKVLQKGDSSRTSVPSVNPLQDIIRM